MSVLEFIDTHCQFHSEMTYDEKLYGFDVRNFSYKIPGIYFITATSEDGTRHIVKVGKADGREGLKGRISQYRSKNYKRVGKDRTIDFTHKAMSEIHKKYGEGCVLNMYVHLMEKTVTEYHGILLESSFIRSLEEKLTLQAYGERHPMLLSGQK
jgi:hypothetical protein